jgi:DNA-binding NarL/FixJ family response regulator
LSREFVITVDDNDRLLPVKDKITGRRIKVAKLIAKGMTLTEISMEVQASLSTIEKDVRFIRENGRMLEKKI